MWEASDIRRLSINEDGRRPFRAERLDPPEQLLWDASRFHPLSNLSLQTPL
jgi:hypothetical protein